LVYLYIRTLRSNKQQNMDGFSRRPTKKPTDASIGKKHTRVVYADMPNLSQHNLPPGNPKKQKRSLFKRKRTTVHSRTYKTPEKLTLQLRIPKFIRKFVDVYMGLPFLLRVFSIVMVLTLVIVSGFEIYYSKEKPDQYVLGNAEVLLKEKRELLGESLKISSDGKYYKYNEDYQPSEDVQGSSSVPKFTADFATDPSKGVTITDVVNEVSMTLVPEFSMQKPKQDENRLVYPMKNNSAKKVYTLGASVIKEDILLNEYIRDDMKFEYKLDIPTYLEPRLESDGSIGIYGPSNDILMGQISAGTEKDQELLDTARKNAKKNTLVFRLPAPYVLQANKIVSQTAKAYFSLDGDMITLHTTGLQTATYPLTIDPSVYIETAAQLMRGNNETNTDFDIDDELIQKSQTTGARINAWQDNLDMSSGVWDQATVASGGYIYRVGGRSGPTKPSVVASQETLDNSDGTTFTMSMPSSRPAGDLYVALMCHDGSSGSNMTAPSGWTEYADLQGHAAYYKVGTDQGGGNEAATYQWTGPNERYAGIIVRVTGINSTTPVNATNTGSAGSGTPTFPAVTPTNDATLILRGTGFDQDPISATAWVPSGHTKIGSNSTNGSGGGNNTCGYSAASLDTPPLSGVAAAAAAHADASVNDDYGASSIAINPATTSSSTQTTVNWAKFNSTSLAIESPNPGTGTCSGWCSPTAGADYDYSLPSARRALSLIAYNGYLYAIGGLDSGGTRASTIYIAKLGANGEPQKWHPTGGTPGYWYTDTGLSAARSYHSVVAFNNRMYVVGGQTAASPNGTTSVEYANINPNGTLSSWSSGTALPAGAGTHMASVQQYNGVIYTIGGFEGARTSSANLRSAVYYNKINSDGTMNSWVAAASITTARATFGGNYAAIWGAYIYLSGGCTAVNGSGHCTTVASDTQIGSINADGSISEWGSISNLQNQRVGYYLVGWQNGLYRLGGCAQVNTTSGECASTLADVDYGVINAAGEVSTVSISEPSGTAPCNGSTPYNCDIPPPGDDAGEGGQMLSMTAILNGYLYIIGGCIAYTCGGSDAGSGDDSDITGNISYASIDSSGRLTAPPSCAGTSYGAWCVDSTNRVNGTVGVAAAGIATFNNRLYLVGGVDNSADGNTNIYYNSTNPNGSLTGAWSTTTFAAAGVTGEIGYTYAYARANPSSTSNPGNLYIMGGCGAVSASSAGCSSVYRTEVYKCDIASGGAVSGCDTSGQLQIDSELADETDQGLGLHSGTVNANYIYLIGGYSDNVSDRDTVYYAKFDNNNNIVSVATSAAGGNSDDWILSTNTLSVGRRRGWAFGYNGHIYSVGGYDAGGTGIIPFIEWSKMDVSDGSIDSFVTSSVTINQRWGLSMVVSNSYAYVIGGCDVGVSPGGCSSFENSIQTFQLYNNDSGAYNNFTAQSDQTFTADTDRWGSSATIYNGYIYIAGGCISTTDCTNATNSVQYAPISATDGTIGTWAAGGNLPADRAWGSLEVAGGTLYYIGGQDDAGTGQTAVYYTSSISSGNPTWSGTAASNGLPSARTRFGSAVWNDRLYIVGGVGSGGTCTGTVCDTVYVSPQQSSGGNISSAWATSTAFNVDRSGAAVTAYANNLYLFGGHDGTNYFSDTQFTQINSDGTVDSWSYSTSLPGPLRDARAVSANGYIYLIGGRSTNTACTPNVLITPILANTTIATGNDPTGVGEWYETNVRYGSGRYGAAVAYDKGKTYVMGGGCTYPIGPNYTTGTIQQTGTAITGTGTNWTDDLIGSTITYADASTATIMSVNSTTSITVNVSKTVAALSTYTISSTRHYYGTVKSQPQVAIYSRMIDTDTDVFPTNWLMNGLDNSIGARWQVRYRTMHDLDAQVNPNEDCGTSATMPAMTTWGQDTNFGDVTLGKIETYTPKNSSGSNINCARYYYFYISIDASKTFGYPEDVNRGPTIYDISLFYTADPSKRLRHGKTFTGGEQQPLDTPCRVSGGGSNNANCALP
jgi:hypothetical protein